MWGCWLILKLIAAVVQFGHREFRKHTAAIELLFLLLLHSLGLVTA
jgi:hypothetical protein